MSPTDQTQPDQAARRSRFVRQGLLGAAAMIAVLTVVSRVLGMVRQMTQASAVGAGSIGDAYNRANTLPSVLYEVVVGGALAGALIPVLAGPVARREPEETRQIIAGALGWVLLLLVPAGLVLAAVSSPLAVALNLSAKTGVDLETLRSTTRFFLLVFAVQVPLYGLTVLANGVLQAHRRFFWPAFTPVLSSLVVIGTYVGYGHLAHGERADPSRLATGALDVLAWGTTAGVVAMCLPVLVALVRMGCLPAPRLGFPTGVGARLRSLAVAGIAGTVVYQVLSFVVVLATSADGAAGTYTVWVWSQQVYILPVAVFAVPLVTSAYPRLSAWAAAGESGRFAALSALSARAVVVAAGAGAAVLAAAAPAVGVVFGVLAKGRQADSAGSGDVVSLMTVALTCTVVGLPGHAVMYQGQRALYALQRAKAALVVGSTGWGLAALTMLVGVLARPPVQLITLLSSAYALGVTVGGVVAVVVVARVVGRQAVAGLVRTSAAVTLGALVAAVAGRWVADSVVMLLGRGIWQGVGAGSGAALVALVLVVAVLYLGDRAGVRGLVALVRDRRRPAVRTGPPDTSSVP